MLAHILTGRGTAEKGLDYKLTGGAPRMSRDGEWSETYACDLFDWYLQTQESLPWLTGTAQWVFKDFTTPLRVDNPVPRVNQKGVTTRDLTPKEGYYVFQSYWTKEPMVRIYGHNWPVRWGKAGQQRMVRIYSNCAEVELWLNGKSVGIKKRTPEDFPCSGLRWDLAFREGENELRAVAKSGSSTVSDSVRFQYQTAAWSKPAKLALRTVQSTTDRVTVEARMLDATGVPCLDSRAIVRFSLAGNGALIDNLGTPNGSRVVQLYNGRAEISLRRTGPVVASVHAEGIESAFLTLENTH
jgi:beta-galactosidase